MTMVERVARAMEPRAFETFDKGYTARNYFEERAFLNAEKVVKRARKKARAAIEAMREPTPAMYEAFGADIDWEVFPGYWQRAIDRALSESA